MPRSPHARHCTHALQRETVCSRRSFGMEVAAAEAYDMAALTLNGLFAPTNYHPDLCARPPRARQRALSKLFPGPRVVAHTHQPLLTLSSSMRDAELLRQVALAGFCIFLVDLRLPSRAIQHV